MKIIILLILILFIYKIECLDNIKNNNENHLYLLGKSGGIVKDYHYSKKEFNDYKQVSSDLIFIGQNQTTEFSTINYGSSYFYLDVVSNKEYYIFVGNLEIGPLFEPESFQINSENQFKFKLIIPNGGFIKVYIGKLDNFNRDESLKFIDSSKNIGFITLDGSFKMSKKDQKLFNEAEFNNNNAVTSPSPTPTPSQIIVTDTPLVVVTETPSPSTPEIIITDTPLVETPSPSKETIETIETKLPELIPAYSSSSSLSSDKSNSEITESSESSDSSSSDKWTSYSSYSYNTIIIDDDENDAALVQQIIQEQQQQQQLEEKQQDTITTTVTTTQESSNYNQISSEGGYGKIQDNSVSGLVEQVFYKNDNGDANDLYEINKSNKLNNNNSVVFLLISIIFVLIL